MEPPATTMERYRQRLRFEDVHWGTHCANCLATCAYRVFTRNGQVVYEEPAAVHEQIEEGVPDLNPMSCQKGAAWSRQLYAPDRVLHPLKRAGERGEGRWQRISWDEALTEIADALIDTIKDEGCESIVFEETTEGGLLCWASYLRFATHIGALTLDGNGLINDFLTGQYMTFGKFSLASSVDDTFHADLILIWHSNPAYTAIPFYHYISESRYHGAEVVCIAPDYNASAVGSDLYLPVRPGTDAALALAMCQVVIEEGLMDEGFVKEQTDLPLLVRQDTGRFLCAQDVDGGGREQFYWWDADKGLTQAGRASLALDGMEPRLEGTFEVEVVGEGEQAAKVAVRPAFAIMKERLEGGYRPEQAAAVCGVNAGVIRDLARKVAARPTKVLTGFNTPKYFHGDLIERSMMLLLALTGNWGRKGRGPQGLCVAGLDGYFFSLIKQKAGLAETEGLVTGIAAATEGLKSDDPSLTDEMAGLQLMQAAVAQGNAVPPVFFWYHHCGYREVWNNRDWCDESMPRPFDDYFREATEKGWWAGSARPGPDCEPRVLFGVATNTLRRTRGGRRMLLEHLWPKLKLIVSVDWRMSSTGAFSDIVLPAACQYERPNLQYPLTYTLHLGFSDRCAKPQGEAKSEWEIFKLLSEKVAERAGQRGFVEFKDGRRQPKRLDTLAEQFTSDGAFNDEEDLIDEWVRDSTVTGTLPAGTSISSLRESGTVRFTGLGILPMGLGAAADVSAGETFTAFGWHVEKKVPYPTLTRRAQFYIDHPWFIEAGEELPCHKEPPMMGGHYPLTLTSGHSRWSIHSTNNTSRLMLETHRGTPCCIINPAEASRRGIADGDRVTVYNDCGSFELDAKITPAVRPGQIVIYNGWDPFMFSGWRGASEIEPGMVKWLHLVSRYGHLRYFPFNWQPVQSDRAVRVDIKPKLSLAGSGDFQDDSNDETKEAR